MTVQYFCCAKEIFDFGLKMLSPPPRLITNNSDSVSSSPNSVRFKRRPIQLYRDYSPMVIKKNDPLPVLNLQYTTNYATPNYIPRVIAKVESTVKHHEPLAEKLSANSKRCYSAFMTFARESTIHGIWHMTRSDRHWLSRIAWAVAFAISLVACFYFISMSFVRYLSYDVKTTTSVEVAREVDFPAITFCNQNLGKRSLVGLDNLFMQVLTAFAVTNREEFVPKFQSVLATCKHSEDETTNKTILEEMKSGYDFWRHVGMTKGFSILTPDSFFSVAKCWWKNIEKNCSAMFLNHMTDHGWCFTINPHPDVVKSYSLGYKVIDTGYGLEKGFEYLKLISTGPKNNLRLLLNVHQEEYCISQHDTAGFVVLIHNPRIQPLFFLGSPLYFAPGYETHVSIRFRRDVKLTEDLGRCTQYKRLSLYPNATVYFKEACYLECFSRNVYEHCKCVPAYGPPRSNYVIADEMKMKYVNVCFSEMLCMKDYERKFLDQGLQELCENCVDPCNETEYDFHVSYSYFPAAESFAVYSNLTKVNSLQEFRDNFLIANFYVENMLINVITETQAFTIDQLVADMGGQLGFLLGMSVLSLFEIVQFIMPRRP